MPARDYGIQERRDYITQVRAVNAAFYEENGLCRTAFVQTFGCQMNAHESEKLLYMLGEMGFTEAENAQNADLVIFNTCCIRENAKNKAYGHMGALAKKEGKKQIVAVCGCLPQLDGEAEKITRLFPHVGIIFGTFNLPLFPRFLYEYLTTGKKITDRSESACRFSECPSERKNDVKAYVNIMYGCDNFCSYCVVPYVRGREYSRPSGDILAEVRALAEDGVKEVCLLGQNVNSYGKDSQSETFPALLRKINAIEGLSRVRFMTSHPKDCPEALIDALAECEKVCPHIHLPVQSGSTAVLAAMNRRYTKEDYLTLIQKLREKIPDIAVTTDIMVGFPGETESDFEDTLDVVKKASFAACFTFIYSKREGTAAFHIEQTAPAEIINARFARLTETANAVSLQKNSALIGAFGEVLIEDIKDGVFTGRTPQNTLTHVKSNGKFSAPKPGGVVKIKIVGAKTFYLQGELV